MTKEEVLKAVEELIGDKDLAQQWLEKPCRGLGDKIPIKMVETQEGIDELEMMIGRLEHGVF